MSSVRSNALEDNDRRLVTRISPPQFALHLRAKSYSSPLPLASSAISTKRSDSHIHTTSSTTTNHPSPLKMVTTSSAPRPSAQDTSGHYLDVSSDAPASGWMESTVIEDDDLMFGGKSLSAWYEEDRQKVGVPEEERRGRQRVRQHHSYSHPPTKSKPMACSEQKQKKH